MVDRRKYIGSSDAGSLFLANGYRAIREVWLYKTGRIPNPDLSDNRQVQRGNFIEPEIDRYVREYLDESVNSHENFCKWDFACPDIRYARQKLDEGDQIMLLDDSFIGKNGNSYVGGHPDGISDTTVWEYKAPTPRSLDFMLEKTGVHAKWLLQVQHILMITGLPVGKLALWDFNTWEPIVIPVEPDRETHIAMRDFYRRFWEHVENDTPPVDLYPDLPEYMEVIENEDLDEVLSAYHKAYKSRYAAKDLQKQLKGLILTYADGREQLNTDNFNVNISEVDAKDFSYTRLVVKPK